MSSIGFFAKRFACEAKFHAQNIMTSDLQPLQSPLLDQSGSGTRMEGLDQASGQRNNFPATGCIGPRFRACRN